MSRFFASGKLVFIQFSQSFEVLDRAKFPCRYRLRPPKVKDAQKCFGLGFTVFYSGSFPIEFASGAITAALKGFPSKRECRLC